MKLVQIIYVLVLAATLAAGCGSGSSDPNPNTDSSGSSSTDSGNSSSNDSGDSSNGNDSGNSGSNSGNNAACSDYNNVDQPDMTGQPFWSSSIASIDSEVILSVPVDEDTGHVGVTLFHVQREDGSTIVIGGFGRPVDITPGQARTVSVSVNINFPAASPLAGNYFPVIHLCKSADECFDGQNIHYGGGGDFNTTINNGDQYGRIHNEGSENIDMQTSCFLIPILSVTE